MAGPTLCIDTTVPCVTDNEMNNWQRILNHTCSVLTAATAIWTHQWPKHGTDIFKLEHFLRNALEILRAVLVCWLLNVWFKNHSANSLRALTPWVLTSRTGLEQSDIASHLMPHNLTHLTQIQRMLLSCSYIFSLLLPPLGPRGCELLCTKHLSPFLSLKFNFFPSQHISDWTIIVLIFLKSVNGNSCFCHSFLTALNCSWH
jgi:hypothetical protein